MAGVGLALRPPLTRAKAEDQDSVSSRRRPDLATVRGLIHPTESRLSASQWILRRNPAMTDDAYEGTPNRSRWQASRDRTALPLRQG